MRSYQLLILIVCGLLLLTCKKSHQQPQETQSIDVQELFFYKDLQIDSVKMLSMIVSFQMSRPGTTPGIITSLDSIDLINRIQDYMKRDLVFRDNRYSVKIEWPLNVPPKDDIFWFRLFVKNDDGTTTYSKVFKQAVATYEIKNTKVVNGNGAFNKHPKTFFINYEESFIGNFDNALMVEAVTHDVNPQHYKGSLNGVSISVNKVDPKLHSDTHKQVVFDVPDDQPLGSATFKLYYLNKLVLTEQVEIVNGGLLTKDLHVQGHSDWQGVFVHDNELYTLYQTYSLGDNRFYKWNPVTKQLTQIPNPRHNLSIGNLRKAYSINGLVYFPPVFDGYTDGSETYHYKEAITTYSPANNTWNELVLLTSNEKNRDKELRALESFVIGEKYYTIVSETVSNTNDVRIFLKVYHVKDKSWKDVMELPNRLYRATVLNGKAYLLTSEDVHETPGMTTFRNEFLLLDLDNKTYTRKNWISRKNVATGWSYLISHRGKIYLYGGHYSFGYTSLYSSVFAVYDSMKDSWSPVSGYSYFTAWVSQTDGFMLAMNDNIYIGLGLDRFTNGHIHGSAKNYTISQLSIR